MKIQEYLDGYGNRWWYMGNVFHREDGPAIIYNNGEEAWYLYNKVYNDPKEMPLNLFLAYCKWEYNKNGK